MVAMASLYLRAPDGLLRTLWHAPARSAEEYGGWGQGQYSHALAPAAHGLGADEEELALGDLHDLRRVGIVCDACTDDVSAPSVARPGSGSRTPDFAYD